MNSHSEFLTSVLATNAPPVDIPRVDFENLHSFIIGTPVIQNALYHDSEYMDECLDAVDYENKLEALSLARAAKKKYVDPAPATPDSIRSRLESNFKKWTYAIFSSADKLKLLHGMIDRPRFDPNFSAPRLKFNWKSKKDLLGQFDHGVV